MFNPFSPQSTTLFYAGIAVFVLAMIALGLFYDGLRSRKLKALSHRAKTTLKICPICQGEYEEGKILARPFSFRTSNKSYMISGLRCKNCGHIELFT